MLLSEIVAGAKFRADLQNTNRVTQDEWRALLNETLLATWELASAARPDFQVTSVDTAVVNGGSASIAVPDGISTTATEFYSLIDVVFAPDTTNEYSLGPFAWQNRRSPGGWLFGGALFSTGGASRARLMGNSVFLEPSSRAAGNYRLWYVPMPKLCAFAVRLATAAALPACTPAGTGSTHTLTANANGALTVDGVAVAANDLILVNLQASPKDNGIYFVSNPGSGGAPFILIRAINYNAAPSQVRVGNVISIGNGINVEGAVNYGKFFELTAFGGTLDTDSLTYAEAQVDAILARFRELLIVTTALPALTRDDDLDPAPLLQRQGLLVAQLQMYLRSQRSANGPAKMVDTDAQGPASGWWR